MQECKKKHKNKTLQSRERAILSSSCFLHQLFQKRLVSTSFAALSIFSLQLLSFPRTRHHLVQAHHYHHHVMSFS